MTKFLKTYSIVLLGMFVIAAGCTESDTDDDMEIETSTSETEGQMDQQAMNSATVTLEPTEGYEAQGSVTFTEAGDEVRVEGDFTGLSAGMHGFHIHENGDCSAPDATSAGGHFNPAGNEHGARTDSVRHMGDLGNIEAGDQGNASVSFTDAVITLDQIIGRAVVLHSGEDDFTSQPSGAAGARVACGVIESAQADTTMGNTEGGNM